MGDVFLAVPSDELKQVGWGVTRQFVCVSIDQGGKKTHKKRERSERFCGRTASAVSLRSLPLANNIYASAFLP